MSNYKYEWIERAPEESQFVGVKRYLTCEGALYYFDIVVHADDSIVGTLWSEISSTYWEQGYMVTVSETAYDSVDEAKAALERHDLEEWTYESKIEAKYAEYLASQEN